MKILMVNKFLYSHGGSETYILDIGEQLVRMGHEVQYFGMESTERTVGNEVNSYTASMDFHGGGLKKIFYPFKIIYSAEARKKIRLVLDAFEPEVVHLNNINFQLTPSIILEIRKWERQTKAKVKIVYTAHDFQWVCPNHILMIPKTKERCFKCKSGRYVECTRNRCIHNSRIKSFIGSLEAYLYRYLKTYNEVDRIICPSYFMRNTLASNPAIENRLVVLHNYCGMDNILVAQKREYVLYFGRYAEEKGIKVLLEVCKELSNIPFIFAGDGPLKKEVGKVSNITDVGFLTGNELKTVIAEARLSVVPSIWYENCPFAVIESQMYGTPVIASDIGGIPELIDIGKTGEIVEAGNVQQLTHRISELWNDSERCREYSSNCRGRKFDNLQSYCERLLEIYN